MSTTHPPPKTSPHALRRRVKRFLHSLSLTSRLVTVLVLLVLAAYLATTAVTATMLRDYLTDRTDSELQSYSESLEQLALSASRGIQTQVVAPPNAYYVAYTPADGGNMSVLTAPPTTDNRPDLGGIGWADPRANGTAFTVSAQDGSQEWRAVVRQLEEGQGVVSVAVPLGPIDSTVKQLWLLTAIVGAATLVAVALLGWMGVRRAFRPLSRIEDTAAAIADGDLARRVPPTQGTDEVASLSNSLNRMLADLERSFSAREASEERMRLFVADASHELRTPLATVKGYAELYRVGGVTDPDDVGQAMRRIEDEATRMSHLVEDLLWLTRLDSEPSFDRTSVDLTVLVADIVQDAQVRSPERPIRMVPLVAGGTGPVHTTGDDHSLRQLLTNLVANALAHTPEETPVEIAVGREGGTCVVEIRDHGPGISDEAAQRVFERFYRADKSRSRASGGTGLGLAIVSAIVSKHSGTVQHRPTPGGGATFRVELPLRETVSEHEHEDNDD